MLMCPPAFYGIEHEINLGNESQSPEQILTGSRAILWWRKM
jgi:hypothetical protein